MIFVYLQFQTLKSDCKMHEFILLWLTVILDFEQKIMEQSQIASSLLFIYNFMLTLYMKIIIHFFYNMYRKASQRCVKERPQGFKWCLWARFEDIWGKSSLYFLYS